MKDRGKGGEKYLKKYHKESIKEMKKKCGGITGYDTSKNLQVVNKKNLHSPPSLPSCDTPRQRLTGDFNLLHCILDGQSG